MLACITDITLHAPYKHIFKKGFYPFILQLGALNSNTSTYPPYLLTAVGLGYGHKVSL